MNLIGYRDRRWYDKRLSIIKRDNYTCTHCHKTFPISELQVHHQTYIKGKHPWEYEDVHLITLCRGCHAERHNVLPSQGWTYEGMYDLEEPIGTCDNCGTTIRYEHYISHPIFGFMTVGSQCAEKLTQFYGLSEREKEAKRLSDKFKRYVESPKWKFKKNGRFYNMDGYIIKIWDHGSYFNLQIGIPVWHRNNLNRLIQTIPEKTKKRYQSFEDAQKAAFNTINDPHSITIINDYILKHYKDVTPYRPILDSDYD